MKRFAFALAGIALAAVSAAAAAQWKPSRPVTIIVPWSAGGSTDQVEYRIRLFNYGERTPGHNVEA